jgi:hypothetical protein
VETIVLIICLPTILKALLTLTVFFNKGGSVFNYVGIRGTSNFTYKGDKNDS